MSYAELPARPELRPWIAAHWCFRVAGDAREIEHTVPLTGGVMVHLHNRFPDTPVLTGPRTAPLRTVVRGGDEFWGTHLWPGAAGSLLGGEASALRGVIAPAQLHLPPPWCRRLAEEFQHLFGSAAGAGSGPDGAGREVAAVRTLDRAWGELAAAARPLDRQILHAVFLLLRSAGEEPVGRLAAAVDLSPRHFRRRFRAAVGLTPKELARLRRLRASAAGWVKRSGAGGARWVDLAAEHGYADQAHLVREYRSLLGTTPTGFREHADRIEHGDILS